MQRYSQGEKIIVVVPARNEASVITEVTSGLGALGITVLVVDDGSTDATGSLAERAGAIVLRHCINRGQGAALATGTRYALELGAQVVVHFDADGQHDPRDVARLVEPVATHRVEVALGSRFLGAAPALPLVRRVTLQLGRIFMRVFSGLSLTDPQNGLRAFSRRAAEQVEITHDGMAHASEILDTIADRQLSYLEVPVMVRYTPYSLSRGQGSLNAWRIVRELIISKFFSR